MYLFLVLLEHTLRRNSTSGQFALHMTRKPMQSWSILLSKVDNYYMKSKCNNTVCGKACHLY